MSRFFEDIAIGEEMELGTHLFTGDAIKAFAQQFDPQPFHLDEAAAEASHFGGLCASGWHTAAVWMKLMIAFYKREARAMMERGEKLAKLGPSPGFRDLKWIKPVYAGSELAYKTRIADKVDLASKPEWGLLISHNEAHCRRQGLVFSFTGQVFLERRSPPLES